MAARVATVPRSRAFAPPMVSPCPRRDHVVDHIALCSRAPFCRDRAQSTPSTAPKPRPRNTGRGLTKPAPANRLSTRDDERNRRANENAAFQLVLYPESSRTASACGSACSTPVHDVADRRDAHRLAGAPVVVDADHAHPGCAAAGGVRVGRERRRAAERCEHVRATARDVEQVGRRVVAERAEQRELAHPDLALGVDHDDPVARAIRHPADVPGPSRTRPCEWRHGRPRCRRASAPACSAARRRADWRCQLVRVRPAWRRSCRAALTARAVPPARSPPGRGRLAPSLGAGTRTPERRRPPAAGDGLHDAVDLKESGRRSPAGYRASSCARRPPAPALPRAG